MPSIRMVKMNMVVQTKRPQNIQTKVTPAPVPVTHAFGKSKLYAPMVMRISGAKSGCGCGA